MVTESVKRRILPYLKNINSVDCILYKKLGVSGYGDIQEIENGKKKHNRAHRVAYEVYYKQEIPEGKIVLHSCDVPACVNPLHLSIGTHANNVADKVNKDRQAKGRKNGRYKHGHFANHDHVEKVIEFQSICNRALSKDQVIKIKELLKSNLMKCSEIAKHFNVKETVIRDISCGRTYKNV